MKEKIKKIRNKVTSSPYKYIIIFIVVFFCISVTSYALLIDFEGRVDSQNIQYVEFTVKDKYVTNETIPRYILVGDDNNTYEVLNDNAGKRMFDKIDIGTHYRFIVQKGQQENDNIYVIQVYNETGGHQI